MPKPIALSSPLLYICDYLRERKQIRFVPYNKNLKSIHWLLTALAKRLGPNIHRGPF